jgi:hypothetical protein
MAIAYGSIGTTDWTDVSSSAYDVTITKPTGLAEGDLMVAVLFVGGHTGALTEATNSGWTSLGNSQQTNAAIVSFYKEADSGDVAASNFTLKPFTGTADSGDWSGGSIVRITGTEPVLSSDYVSLDISTGFTPPVSSLMIMAGMNQDAAVRTPDSYAITTDNPTWTERAEETESSSSPDLSFGVATASRSETTATGTWDITWSGGSTDEAILISIFEAQNVTITGIVGDLTLNGNVGAISGEANITGIVGDLNLNGNVGTVTTPAEIWSNDSKNSSTWTNQSKS